jgi:hypothetical protein
VSFIRRRSFLALPASLPLLSLAGSARAAQTPVATGDTDLMDLLRLLPDDALLESTSVSGSITILRGALDALSTARLAQMGYERIETDDAAWYTIGEVNLLEADHDIHRLHLGYLRHVAMLDDGTVVGTSEPGAMEHVLALHAGEGIPPSRAVAVIVPEDPVDAEMFAETVTRRLTSEAMPESARVDARSWVEAFPVMVIETAPGGGSVVVELTPVDGVPSTLLTHLRDLTHLPIFYWVGEHSDSG